MVTRHGEPAYVLLSLEEYERLRGGGAGEDARSFFERIVAPGMTASEDALFVQVMSEVEGERKRDFGRPPLEW